MKILIIDDEEFFIENLAQYLKKKIPAEISYVSRAEEALNLLEKEKFDLVICDLNLPHQAEGELVLRINQLVPDQKFIIISVIAEHELPKVIRENKKLHIVAYFEKPFNIVLIRNKILTLKNLQFEKSVNT